MAEGEARIDRLEITDALVPRRVLDSFCKCKQFTLPPLYSNLSGHPLSGSFFPLVEDL